MVTSLIVKNGMKLVARIHWRTLIAALGIGLVVELLLVRLYLWYLPGALAASQNGQTNLWLWEAIRLTQQPSLGLMQSWIGVVRPGYGGADRRHVSCSGISVAGLCRSHIFDFGHVSTEECASEQGRQRLTGLVVIDAA